MTLCVHCHRSYWLKLRSVLSLISASLDLVSNEPACCAGINLQGSTFRSWFPDFLKIAFSVVSNKCCPVWNNSLGCYESRVTTKYRSFPSLTLFKRQVSGKTWESLGKELMIWRSTALERGSHRYISPRNWQSKWKDENEITDGIEQCGM